VIQIFDKISSDIDEIKNIIKNLLSDKHISVQKTYNYLSDMHGKMLRPSLIIISAILCDKNLYEQNKSNIHKIAASIELLHVASLVHDDVIDNAVMRRNKETINHLYGNKHAVIIGDIIISESFKMLCSIGNHQIITDVINVASLLSEGEIIQEDSVGNTLLNIDEYKNIINKKTSSLFEVSMKLPALLFSINDPKLSICGSMIGLIFQMVDDILDYDAKIITTGKNEYSDFFESKITLPIIFLMQDVNKTEHNEITKIFENKVKTQKDLSIILDFIKKYNIIQKCNKYIATNINDLKDVISKFDNQEMKNILLETVDFIAIRNF
jgi:octaprenyl-diphosphate synthase